MGLFVLVLLVVLTLGGFGTYLLSANSSEKTGEEPLEQVAVEEQPPEVEVVKEEKASRAAPVPEDPRLYLTVPRLRIHGHTVRNYDSETALNLGAIKLPGTGFPQQKEDTNTYIACHRIGWPGTESYNQCLNLPSMQKGDEVILSDANGTVYRYRVSEVFAVRPYDTWAMEPLVGRNVGTLQTRTEAPQDWWTIGPSLFGGAPESGRLLVRADRAGQI